MTDDVAPVGPAAAASVVGALEPADAVAGGDAELLGLIDRLAELLQR